MIVVINKKFLVAAALLLVVAALIVLCTCKNNNFQSTIDEKLHNIMYPKDSSVLLSSRADDYIKASYADYKYIVEHGEKSLNYLLYKFSINDEDGLEQGIMAIACSEILEETSHVRNWMSGRDWYNKYSASDECIARRLFVDYLEKYKKTVKLTWRISDYSISRIDIKNKYESGFRYGVTYSVKPFFIIEGYSDWEVGNGRLASDGWARNKYYEITVTKTEKIYKITQMATGG